MSPERLSLVCFSYFVLAGPKGDGEKFIVVREPCRHRMGAGPSGFYVTSSRISVRRT